MRLSQAQTKAGVEIQHAREEMELEMYMKRARISGEGISPKIILFTYYYEFSYDTQHSTIVLSPCCLTMSLGTGVVHTLWQCSPHRASVVVK